MSKTTREWPLYHAKLIELPRERNGGTRREEVWLSMMQRSETQGVSSFRFHEAGLGENYPSPGAARHQSFFVIQRNSDDCGSIHYLAVETNGAGGEVRTLELVDHTTRICDDNRPYIWEIELNDGDDAARPRLFGGNPKASYITQSM